MLGAYFGVGNLVWAAIISLILLYLAVAYFIGGRWADSKNATSSLFVIGALAGVAVSCIPLLASIVLPVVVRWNLPNLIAIVVVIALLYLVPVVLLGVISPFAIRHLIVGLNGAGSVAGAVYSFGTLGSMVGSLVSVLLLLPLFGTRMTYLLAGGLLVCASILGLYLEERLFLLRWVWLLLVFLGVVILTLR